MFLIAWDTPSRTVFVNPTGAILKKSGGGGGGGSFQYTAFTTWPLILLPGLKEGFLYC